MCGIGSEENLKAWLLKVSDCLNRGDSKHRFYCTLFTFNRSYFTIISTLQAFAKMFNSTPDDLDMHVIYDVSHNIAKVEEHFLDGKQKTLLVHRKGSTRAFPPHHPLIPVDYQVPLQ